MMQFHFSKQSRQDLIDIFDYTLEKFGEKQAHKYIGQLEECTKQLAGSKRLIRVLSHLDEALRYTRCHHHYIFGLWKKDQPLYIIAILHERMDLVHRVKSRLDVS